MLNIKTFVFNPFGENTYLLWDDTSQGAVIDPGALGKDELERFYRYVREEGIDLRFIALTHAHFDHIFGVKEVAEHFGIPVYMDPDENATLDYNRDLAVKYSLPAPDCSFAFTSIKEDDILSFGDTGLKVISTPGHSPGGVCFLDEKDGVLLSGDTLFAGSIGRTDSPIGDYDRLIVGIMDKLMGLPSDTEVLTGHGPTTDIGHERTHNPFLQPFNEKEEDLDEGLFLEGDFL